MSRPRPSRSPTRGVQPSSFSALSTSVEIRHVVRTWFCLPNLRPPASELDGKRREFAETGRPSGDQLDGRRRCLFTGQQLNETNDASRSVVYMREIEGVTGAVHSEQSPENVGTTRSTWSPVAP